MNAARCLRGNSVAASPTEGRVNNGLGRKVGSITVVTTAGRSVPRCRGARLQAVPAMLAAACSHMIKARLPSRRDQESNPAATVAHPRIPAALTTSFDPAWYPNLAPRSTQICGSAGGQPASKNTPSLYRGESQTGSRSDAKRDGHITKSVYRRVEYRCSGGTARRNV